MAKQPLASASRVAASRVVARARVKYLRHNTNKTPPAWPTSLMCGIFFSLSRHEYVSPDKSTVDLLHNRGPDFVKILTAPIEQDEEDGSPLYATFLSTVLSLRGTEVVKQPTNDHVSLCTLCWNGEAWSVNGNLVIGSDTQVIYDLLVNASATGGKSAVIELLSNIRGPYAIVFWDTFGKCLYYGRDCLGRRSLLRKIAADGSLLLSSVCDNASGEGWEEVEADGIYMLDLDDVDDPFSTQHVPHTRMGEDTSSTLSFVGKFCVSRCPLTWPETAVSTIEPRGPRCSRA
jgi:asparagine synthetase B (glutamine-hydrolysing)